jgi:hypothetical protein
MTSPYVTSPRPRHQEPWRIVLVVLFCVAAPPAAAVVGFIGAIVWSGCLMECTGDSGNTLSGAALLLLALALLLFGPALAWLLLRRWTAVALAAAGVVATLATGALLIGAN